MKKKIISIFLCVLMVMTAIAGYTVHADEEVDFIVIGSERIEATDNDIFEDGTAAYNAETKTLTLSGFTYDGTGSDIDGKSAAIYTNTDLNLVIEGENEVAITRQIVEENADVYGLYAAGNLTVSGEGSITAAGSDGFGAMNNTNSTGIYCGGLFKVTSGTVEGIAKDATVRSCGVNAKALRLEGGKLTGTAAKGGTIADGFSLGVRVEGETVISAGEILGIGGDHSANSYGIHITDKGQLTVTGGNVYGKGGSFTAGSSSGLRVASSCGDTTVFTDGIVELEGETYGYDGDFGPHLGGRVEMIVNGGFQGFSTSMSLRHPKPYFDGLVKMTAGDTASTAKTIEAVGSYDYEDRYVRIKMAGQYEDVDLDSWYANAVRFCSERTYITGTTETRFAPNAIMTRAMFVQMLAKMGNADLTAYGNMSTFSDVPAGTWYSAAVEWANANGITNGVGDGRFAPNGQISREQIAVFFRAFAAYKGYDVTISADITRYTDADIINSWAVTGLKWAVGCDIISGTSATTLSPLGTATRCQVAQMAMKFCMKFGI